MATTQELQQIQNTVDTKGYAYLSSGQKAIYNQGGQAMGAPNVSDATKSLYTGPQINISEHKTPNATSTPTIISSNSGKKTNDDNLSNLQQLETSYTVQPGDTLSQIAQQQGTDVGSISGYRSGDPNLIFPGEQLTIRGTSLSTMSMADAVNKASQEGITDPQGMKSLKEAEAGLLSMTAQARSNQGNPLLLDEAMKGVEQYKKQYEERLSDYFKGLTTLREERARLAVPGQREIELQKMASNIKTDIDQIRLANEQRKFQEYEGQTAGFARGRGGEFDIKTGFQVMERQLELNNVLGELGIEAGIRGASIDEINQSLQDFQNDFELQTQIEDRIQEYEQTVIDRMDVLDNKARNDLDIFLSQLEGVNPDELDQATISKLQQTAQIAGIPYELIEDGLRVQYQRDVFERAKKTTTQIQSEEQSNTINQILDGFTNIDELTPSKKQDVKNTLYEMGFNSDTPPDWFKEYMQSELKQSLLPEAVKEEWIKYRDSILKGKTETDKQDTLNFDEL